MIYLIVEVKVTPSTTVRITEDTRKVLKKLSILDKTSMQGVLEQAIEIYRRQRFLNGLNVAYASLRKDEEKWQNFNEELEIFDTSLADGIKEEDQTCVKTKKQRKKKQ